ncbi:hypothetical protein ACO2Q8_22580 [Larkinella sp. VNQ87]|uniref:hypothetical protein n=1 Tax=Larkinella sp. VNQ87 TaxID=3400921 RepID=UPI003C1026C1
MNVLAFGLLFVVLTGPARAQNCDLSSILTIPGKWTPGMQGSTSGTTAADLAREKTLVGALHTRMQQRYKPMGVDADYNGIYMTSADRPANSFGYALRAMPYVCRENRAVRAIETNTSLYIMANEITFGPEIFETFRDGSPWDLGFHAMRKLPVEQDSVLHWVEETSLGFGNRGVQHTWLITYDGRLPFQYVSRKEFLEKKKAKLTAGRQTEIETIKSNYRTAPKAELDQRLQKATQGFDAALAKVESYLKEPSAELAKPAIVKQDPQDFLSHLFTTPDDPFANVPIKPNPAYFNRKLPRSSPQFFTVVLKGDEKNLVLGRAMQEIRQSLDFGQLKALLGR